MKTRMKNLLLLLLLLGLPGVAQAQDAYSTNANGSIYTYSTNADGSANNLAYAGPPWVVTLQAADNGLTTSSYNVESATSLIPPVAWQTKCHDPHGHRRAERRDQSQFRFATVFPARAIKSWSH